MTDKKNYLSNHDVQNSFEGDSKIKFLKEKIIACCVLLALVSFSVLWYNSSNSVKPIEKKSSLNKDLKSSKTVEGNIKTKSEDVYIEESKVDTSLDVISNEWKNLISGVDLKNIEKAIENVININLSMKEGAYDSHLKNTVNDLVQMDKLAISANELLNFKKVKSIQGNENGIYTYDYFTCKFTIKNGKIFFIKTTGSQRKSGYIYKKNSESFVFLGGSTVNDDPLTNYGGESSEAGIMFKVSSKKLIMVFADDYNYEILEIII